jgi:hypothetical protein
MLDVLEILSNKNYITASIIFDEVIDPFARKKGRQFFFLNSKDFEKSTYILILFYLLLCINWLLYLLIII